MRTNGNERAGLSRVQRAVVVLLHSPRGVSVKDRQRRSGHAGNRGSTGAKRASGKILMIILWLTQAQLFCDMCEIPRLTKFSNWATCRVPPNGRACQESSIVLECSYWPRFSVLHSSRSPKRNRCKLLNAALSSLILSLYILRADGA